MMEDSEFRRGLRSRSRPEPDLGLLGGSAKISNPGFRGRRSERSLDGRSRPLEGPFRDPGFGRGGAGREPFDWVGLRERFSWD